MHQKQLQNKYKKFNKIKETEPKKREKARYPEGEKERTLANCEISSTPGDNSSA